MTNLDLWNALALGITSLIAGLLFYLWTAIALAAVFRKSGEAGWKAWVPILNVVVLLQLAGLSGWLVLLLLVPVAGWVCIVVAAYRINVAFGHGAGMTVLAAILLPLWATVLGFGSARWVGREAAGHRGPVRTSAPEASADSDDLRAPAYVPTPWPTPGTRSTPPPAGAWTPPPLPPQPAHAATMPPAPPAPPVPPIPRSASAGSDSVSAGPAPARSAFAQPIPPTWADDEPTSAPVDDSFPVPAPRRTPAEPIVWEPADEPDQSWEFDFRGASLTSEVTDAVTGAPAPVSAAPVSARGLDDAPVVADEPPVTRVPEAPAPAAALREPWAPSPSPMPSEGEAFPETSGPVSAIVGAPDAGTPRSALSSVSAMHTRPHIPEEDELDQTIVARRKRTAWILIGPTGSRIPLTGDVAILGRRPSADAAHPGAQLVALDDDTRTISKTHALLELRDDRWFVTDLDSTNGVLFTTLMGTEVAATPGEATEAGDRFLLGDAEVSLSRSDA